MGREKWHFVTSGSIIPDLFMYVTVSHPLQPPKIASSPTAHTLPLSFILLNLNNEQPSEELQQKEREYVTKAGSVHRSNL